jgi:hypothetical protein
MVQSNQDRCHILIVENSDDVRGGLADELSRLGHSVVAAGARDEALARGDLEQFDLIVSDLINQEPSDDTENVRSFKLGVTSSRTRRTIQGLHDIIEKTLWFKLQHIDESQQRADVREKIDLELPSDLTLMNAVLEYLLDRVAKLGLVQVEQSNLFVALESCCGLPPSFPPAKQSLPSKMKAMVLTCVRSPIRATRRICSSPPAVACC